MREGARQWLIANRARWLAASIASFPLLAYLAVAWEWVPAILVVAAFFGLSFYAAVDSIRPLPPDTWRPERLIGLIRGLALYPASLGLVLAAAEGVGLLSLEEAMEVVAGIAIVMNFVGGLVAGGVLRYAHGGRRALSIHVAAFGAVPVVFILNYYASVLLLVGLVVYPLAPLFRWVQPTKEEPVRLYAAGGQVES